MSRPLRVVIDANLHYSAQRPGKSPVHQVERAWQEGLIRPLTSPEVRREVERVIRKKSLNLSAAEVSAFLNKYDERCTVFFPPPGLQIPQCRDAKDQCYLNLAHAAEADFIISGDRDLLVMADTFSVPVAAPRVFAERFL